MHFKLFFLSLLFILGCSENNIQKTINFPFQNIRVSILSKYRLKKIGLQLQNSRIFINRSTFTSKMALWQISIKEKRLFVQSNHYSAYTSEISLSSDKKIAILFHYNNKTYKRSYVGSLDVRIDTNRLLIVNTTPVEYYVQAAAVGELGNLLYNGKLKNCKINWQVELRHAMEIAIRSYIFHFKKRHKSDYYDFCDLTHCIHFPGLYASFDLNKVTNSNGIVMLDKRNNFLCSYFHSTCGGQLVGPEGYWFEHNTYLNFRRGKDRLFIFNKPLCSHSPHFTWSAFIVKNKMYKILKKKYIANIKLIYKDNRVYSMSFTSKGVKYKISASLFLSRAGRLLGWNKIKSNFFEIKKTFAGWLIKGHGLGHGVGLCQYGAQKMACNGKSYKEILQFYYNNPQIVNGNY